MGTVSLILVVLFIIAIVLLVPALLLFFFYKWLSRKGYRWHGLSVITIIIAFFLYEIYTAIYPTNSFYYNEFKQVTSLDIPKSAEIIDKTASYPDFHGDYVSCSLMKLSKQDYNSLLDALNKNKTIIKNPEIIVSEELDEIMKTRNMSNIKTSFSRQIPNKDYYTYIGFFKDNETILVYFVNP
jgi:hypothetical protein